MPCLWKQWPAGLSQCDVGVSPTNTGWWPPSFSFTAVSEALAVPETTATWDVAFSHYPDDRVWRTHHTSSLWPGRRPPLLCCGRRPDDPAAVSGAKES